MPRSSLILDFGGVVTKTVFEQHRHTERALGLPPGTLTWLGPLDPGTDDLWRRVLGGEISEREYWRARAREVGRLKGETWNDVGTFLVRACGGDLNAMVRPEATRAIRRIRATGARVALLSNDLDGFYGRELRSKIDLLSELDVIIDGTRTQVFKPDPRAYALCLQALGAEPADALFVDDQPRNVEGARRAGLQAIQFEVRHPDRCFAEIEALFV